MRWASSLPRAALAVAVLAAVSVGAAPSVSAQAPGSRPLNPDERVCNIGVFGRVATVTPPLGLSEPKEYVRYSGDMGFSAVFSCTFDLLPAAKAKNPSATAAQLETATPKMVAVSFGRGVRRTPALEGVPCRDAEGFCTSVETRMMGGTNELQCYGGKFSTSGPWYAASDVRKGLGHCRSNGGNAPFAAPLITSWQQSAGAVRFSGRIDVEPTGRGRCIPGTFEFSPGWGAGNDNLRCPAAITGTDPAWAVWYLERNFQVGVVYEETGRLNVPALPLDSPHNSMSENGESVPVPFPGLTPPGGGSWAEVGGTCKITGWLLKNLVDGRSWSESSPGRYDILLTAGHEHELTVRFSGRPESIRAQLRRDGERVWQDQAFSPTSPHKFTIQGDGERGLLAVTCIGGDGDIDPEGQTVITDEPENPRTPLDQCIGEADLELTAPSTWIRWAVNGFGCLLNHLFVPYKPLSERGYEIRGSSETALWLGGVVSSAKVGATQLSSATPSNCAGVTINQPAIGVVDASPMSVCEGAPLSQPASVIRAILTGGVILAALMKMVRIAAAALRGESVPVYQAEFNTDISSGGHWE